MRPAPPAPSINIVAPSRGLGLKRTGIERARDQKGLYDGIHVPLLVRRILLDNRADALRELILKLDVTRNQVREELLHKYLDVRLHGDTGIEQMKSSRGIARGESWNASITADGYLHEAHGLKRPRTSLTSAYTSSSARWRMDESLSLRQSTMVFR